MNICLHYYRRPIVQADNFIWIVCICVGIPLIFVKKFLSKRNTQVIPQLNLIPAISNTIQEISPREVENEQSQSFEMETFHTNSRITNVQPIQPSQIANGNEHENEHEHEHENEHENDEDNGDE